ncbi:MAG TPA: glycosyltransferase family 4 protein [Verrucomicrobiae bacterium]|jgi:glycosyltransferase involved in cell wall biosynthesis
MNIVQITPGAGGMYCGNCFRDNAMVSVLRKLGHNTVMVPLYLPMTLEEEDQSAGTPIFFSGINVYLGQKAPLFRHAPHWLHNLLASPKLLKWAAGKAAKTRAEDVGDLTLSMLRGEEGNQARELDELIAWLRTQPQPDVVCLSNALLAGMTRKIREELKAPVVCMLQGEDSFLDGLPLEFRDRVWQTLTERAAEIDHFIAPSRYFGELMSRRLSLAPERVSVVYNGINLQGYQAPPESGDAGVPVIGYFARLCREKGLDTLVDAYILLRKKFPDHSIKLRVGGGCGPSDQIFVKSLQEKLVQNGLLSGVEFHPNVSRAQKLQFFKGLTVFSVPALYGEAFGLYVIEALASGVPVVQPRHAAFPELVETTRGGLLCDPGSAESLSAELEKLLFDKERARKLGKAGREAVFQEFSQEAMVQRILSVIGKVQRADWASASRQFDLAKTSITH